MLAQQPRKAVLSAEEMAMVQSISVEGNEVNR